jgi:hypothetical protein
MAHDLAETQIREGTASSQVVTHFLKLGSTRERLEQQRLAHENELTRVKIEQIESQQRIEELYTEAIKAMRSYAGAEPVSEENDEDTNVS